MILLKRYKFSLTAALVIIVACSTQTRKVYEGQGLATGKSGMNTYTEAEPGETTLLERPYEIAPPLIPHSVTDLNVSRDANDCLDCHLEGDELDEGHVATKIPDSHYLNEYSGKKRAEGVTGIRYNCRQCHVPQAEVGELER